MTPKKRRRARGEGSIYQRKDGLWVAAIPYYTAEGDRRYRRKYSKDYESAPQNLRDLQEESDHGIVGSSSTVGQWLEYWLEDIIRPDVKPNTYRDYSSIIRLYLIPHLGKIKLGKLAPADLRRMHKAVQKRTSSRAAQKAHQLMHQSLKDAVTERRVVRNVAAEMRRPKHQQRDRKAFTAETAKHIMRTAIETRDPLASRWAAAFFTGARQGELLGLTWDRVSSEVMDLSWQLQQLSKAHGCGDPHDHTTPCQKVRPGFCSDPVWAMPVGFEFRECHRSLVWTRPKSAAGTRLVPLAPPLAAMLEVEAQRPGPNPHNLVWHHPDGRPISPRDDYAAWKVLLTTARVISGTETIPLHSARHTTATLLLECGVDARVIKDIVGHSDVVVTRSYQHVDLDLAKRAMGKLGVTLELT